VVDSHERGWEKGAWTQNPTTLVLQLRRQCRPAGKCRGEETEAKRRRGARGERLGKSFGLIRSKSAIYIKCSIGVKAKKLQGVDNLKV